jgi:LmbE family N-acetylglucosaminyl deacetylase
LYAAVRRAESIRALKIIGLENPIFLQDAATHKCFRDQELHRFLEPALQALIQAAEVLKPDALLAPDMKVAIPITMCAVSW